MPKCNSVQTLRPFQPEIRPNLSEQIATFRPFFGLQNSKTLFLGIPVNNTIVIKL